jgi:hypothetical protein
MISSSLSLHIVLLDFAKESGLTSWGNERPCCLLDCTPHLDLVDTGDWNTK